MCGITGYIEYSSTPASISTLKNMSISITHRGPDGEGFWVRNNVAIGHRRLSIIDLSDAGHQPMQSLDGRFILSYNGEVYNYKELRMELERLGHKFSSQTDSEVVLFSLIQWGSEALEKFNGMFALAFWDDYKKTLFVARDRYGIKPLYYYRSNNLFAFASEQKSIIQHPRVKNSIDKEGLMEYFTFQNFLSDRTLLDNIKMFPARC